MKLYTVKVVASWLDMTERNVRELAKKNIIPQYRPGLFKLKDTVHAYIAFLRDKTPNRDENLDYTTERAKMVRTKREAAELDLAERKRELHRSEDVELVMTDMLIRFRTKLMSIPAKQSPILEEKKDQKEIFKILKSAIDEALDELSTYDKAFEQEKEGTDNE